MKLFTGAMLLKTITERIGRKKRNQNLLVVLYVSHIIIDTFGFIFPIAIA